MGAGGGGLAGAWTGAGLLLEREHELATIGAAVAGGGAGLILVEGPAGIGKSRLLAEARRHAADQDFAVLSARGGELEREFPFGVVRQLFESRLVDDEARARLLAGAAGAAAPVFGLHAGQADGDGPGEGSFAALHGLYWLTVNMTGEQPVLLAVDDLHWCDRASLRFLAYLARRVEDLPLLVIGSLRPSEPGSDQALLGELTSDPQAQLLSPGLLTGAAVDRLLRDRLGDEVDPAFSAACHASTRGNPLLLGELVKALVADRVVPDALHVDVVTELGPRAASRAVLVRLARLSRDAVEVARAISVLGEGAELPVVAEVAGLGTETVASAMRELVRAEILRPDPPVGFVHPLVQAAVYRDLAPGERELRHEQAADVLARLAAPTEQVAAQLLAIPGRGQAWVVEVLRDAARIALAKGDPDAATACLRRALGEPPPPDRRFELLLELGAAEALTSVAAAGETMRRALEHAPDAAGRGLASEGLARTLLFLEEPGEAAELARRAQLELPAGLDDLGRRLEALELAAVYFGAEPTDDRLQRLRAHRQIDTSLGLGAKMLAAVAAWAWVEEAGPWEDVCALARAALAGGELLAADSGFTTVIATIGLALADLDEALDVWELIRAEAHSSGSVFSISSVHLWAGFTHYLRGDLAEAESSLRASLETLSFWGIPTQSQWTSAFLAELLVDRGELVEARGILERAVHLHPTSDQAMLLDRAHVTLLLAEGRAEEALERAEAFGRNAGWKRHPRYTPWRSLKAQVLDRLGRREEAVALAAEEVEIARGWGSPGTLGRSLRILGTLEREDGLEHLEQACDLLARAPARLEEARALAALGATIRRARKPTEAREPLRRALELAEVCGATPLVEETRTEIYATGARPRTAALRGVGALTASERRVADLAADGQTNREIAQVLYVTPKTVEVHLSSVYRKLDIGSRRDLAAALA